MGGRNPFAASRKRAPAPGNPFAPAEAAGNKYGAKKTTCAAGHLHDSKAEARRCNELHLLQRGGAIVGLEQQPEFKFTVDGRPVMLDNGQQARLRADFAYVENGRKVVEDRKGVIVRDFPLRWALARTLWPEIDWRVV
ncbi:DUF1064 domain-containing protein [Novosphingobium sp. AP12]|uniref:DUF1064 domain-containing protein n=1 Tax=Novosphingobium sp. AP12 TaxID=1144305 RepID=UPI000271DE0D|nr:DUF1064 domain-containing protein [Novosphingobium sp. AP12]EJL21911.1 Protein of unknown function (DUF1064) [Novosphingobium sp. AP12]